MHGGAGGGGGVIYKLSLSGTITDLYTFPKGYAGGVPYCLAADKAGNLYGVTSAQVSGTGLPTVFKLTPAGAFSTLTTFTSGTLPAPSLLVEADGTVIGTTLNGGTAGAGSVYRITPAGVFSTLFSFPGGADGTAPYGPLIKDAAGNFYGTLDTGGVNNNGVVFKLSAAGTETVLYSFLGGSDGRFSSQGLVRDAAGNLYGTTDSGGTADDGTVFKVAPDGTETVLHSFTHGADGYYPQNPVVLGPAGAVFGTTAFGGPSGRGVVYEITP